MNPIARVMAQPCFRKGRIFAADLAWFCKYGYVWSLPLFFLMAVPIRSQETLFEKWTVQYPQELPTEGAVDCWHLWDVALPQDADASGCARLKVFFDVAPFDLKYVSFHRRDKLRVYQFDTLKRRVSYGQSNG